MPASTSSQPKFLSLGMEWEFHLKHTEAKPRARKAVSAPIVGLVISLVDSDIEIHKLVAGYIRAAGLTPYISHPDVNKNETVTNAYEKGKSWAVKTDPTLEFDPPKDANYELACFEVTSPIFMPESDGVHRHKNTIVRLLGACRNLYDKEKRHGHCRRYAYNLDSTGLMEVCLLQGDQKPFDVEYRMGYSFDSLWRAKGTEKLKHTIKFRKHEGTLDPDVSNAFAMIWCTLVGQAFAPFLKAIL
ncbi:hypothetical protein B0T26DRAFT_674299 [Lasiosphaeria miniovina]|uniref:Uncharacterized protein n=1 Tax=Lasiosphaeria miniovina TaxID=1954250 RepID=A0AA40E0M7_9PEZI|nr:uncharacterized protein B0T26DRAFT_674299 [Lasiosphaeria miniovina]KAK0722615.1 hypothetical protein B0T26DRAFT_674299 [Lasiosphaeria miniovina]